MPRPCNCDRDDCRLCWLWHNDARHRHEWSRQGRSKTRSAKQREGVGTELSAILKGRIGKRLLGTIDCLKCDHRARKMDKKGVDWCKANQDTIAGWLKESARDRGLPFSETAAKSLLKLAIKRAEKKQRSQRNSNVTCKCKSSGACFWHSTIVDEDQLRLCGEGRPPKPSDPPPCMQLREKSKGDKFRCALHGECTIEPNDKRIAACADCKDYVSVSATSEQIKESWIDTLQIYDRRKNPTSALRNMLNGRSAFLVLGGPSLRDQNHELIEQRGVFSLAVNNVAGWVKTSAFVCSDPPEKFHDGIWRDPNVMKIIPHPKLGHKRGKLRRKLPDGEFERLELTTSECPNVWGFQRRAWLSPDASWFCADGAAWGNHKRGVERTGEPKTVGTMLLGLRLLQYLGARRIFLAGCDLKMDERAGLHDNYSFGEERDANACRSNNSQYANLIRWLELLRPEFERFGFETYNVNRHSYLQAFDYVPLEDAVEDCKGEGWPAEPWDLTSWYEGKK